jgi:uncharacterized protein (TIGR03437 family)
MRHLWILNGILAFAQICMALPSAPLKVYVTYLGGSKADTVSGIALDSSGSEYVAGTTYSADFPLTSSRLGRPSEGSGCAYVTKLNPAGDSIALSVCVANSQVLAFGLDSRGFIYLAVSRSSSRSASSYSVLKLDPLGQSIVYDTPIQGRPESLVVDAAGNAYLAGSAVLGFTTTPGAYQTQLSPGTCSVGNGQQPCPDAFALKLAPSGVVEWATYIGGSGPDDAHAIAVDASGSVWIVGETVSPNFPTTPGALRTSFGGEIDLGPLRFGDAFVAKLDPTGSHLLYSTYLGGAEPDGAFAVAVDNTGSAYVTGGTSSVDFLTTPGALQSAYGGPSGPTPPTLAGNAFVTKFDITGTLVYSTFVGAYGTEATAIAVNRRGEAAINAAAQSLLMEATACTGQPMVTVLNSAGSAVFAFSSVSGDYLALDGNGGLYSGGTTRTVAFLSTPHAFQTEYSGDTDGFAAKVDLSQPSGLELRSIVNAATLFGGYSFPATGAVAPGEIVSLFGHGFGSKPMVNFDRFPAPILYASDCQINAVVPFSVTAGLPSSSPPFSTSSTSVTVLAGTQTIGPMELPVVAAVPGVFTLDATGTGQAAIINEDGTVNSPSNPAPRGSTVAVYMTGTGTLTPPIADGSMGPTSPPFPAPVQTISAQIGPLPAPVSFAGQAPTLIAGATQVNVQVPPDAPTGTTIPMSIAAGGYSSSGFSPQESQVFMAIK